MENREKEKQITASVIAVRWERIHLFLDVKIESGKDMQNDAVLDFYMVNQQFAAQAKLKVLGIENGIYHLKVNITNNGANECLPSGQYSIYACRNDAKIADCVADYSIVTDMDELSRNFLYWAMKKVYTVTFYVEEGEEILPFRMNILAANKAGMSFPKNAKLRNQIHPYKDLKKTWLSKRNFLRNLYRIYAVLYKSERKKTVLFLSEQNEVIASNLKAVADRMKARGMESDYRILYSARPAAAVGQGIKSWLLLIKKLGQSGTVFVDDHAPVLDWLKLKEDTKLIQLWHAGAGFKSSGYSRWGHLGCPGPQSAHRQYDYGIAGSRQIAPFFSEVWGINDERVLPTGMPRMDEYLDASYRERKTRELYEKYPIIKEKKVILFAPTYRGKNKKEAYYPYDLIDFSALYELCGEESVVLFKMHPWVNSGVPIEKKYRDRFQDVGKYPNINDLFYITDLLITDYSSNIFEYSLMKKPMLFFAFDKIQYSFSRGFHRDYEESAPGKICYTFAEVLRAIDEKDYCYEKVEEYVEHHFDYVDSHASDRVIDWILLGNIPEDLQMQITKVEEEVAHMRNLDFAPIGISESGSESEEEEEEE